jgi:hypothetical protein
MAWEKMYRDVACVSVLRFRLDLTLCANIGVANVADNSARNFLRCMKATP